MNIFKYIKKYPENNQWLHMFPICLKKKYINKKIRYTTKNISKFWKIQNKYIKVMMIKVSDNWINYPGNFVILQAGKIKNKDKYYINIWGIDDQGVYKYYNTEEQLKQNINSIKKKKIINLKYIKILGFTDV